MKKRALLLGLLAFAQTAVHGAGSDFVGTGTPLPLPAPLTDLLARIDAAALRDHVAWLADPRREGRGLGTRGLDDTADYLANGLAAAGIQPLRGGARADGRAAYFQEVPLREVRAPAGEMAIRAPGAAARACRANVTCVLPQIPPQTLTGPVVFAGWGIREPALGRDDFRGLEVRDKIVVFRTGLPPGAAWQTPELIDRYAGSPRLDRYDARLELLERLGARAAVAIEDDLPSRLATGLEPVAPYFVGAADAPAPSEPPVVRVAPGLADAFIVEDRALAGATASIRVAGDIRPASSRNVIGALEGADPQLRRQAVIIGAHMDHLGMPGGVLHPGADDNASGVAAVLEIAKALAGSPVRPRRTVVFAFWTSEETGQGGSSHYVRHPLWPLERTAAYVNLDMIAHPWTAEQIRALVMAGDPEGATRLLALATPANFAEPGLALWSPELADALATAAGGTGMVLHLDRGDGRNGGSDYRSFARRGLPWIRFFGNFFPGYHEPQDTPDQLDPGQVQRMARLALATAWLLADREARPQ